MKSKLLSFMLALFIVPAIINSLQAQGIKLPAASPLQTIKQEFALSEISVSYSRPSVKGRKIMGDLVPYNNQVWRTGANQPTKITFGEDVKIEGNAIPKGEYALYSIPGKDEWTFILSKNTALWGSMGYKQSDDLVRFKAKPSTLPFSTETFTILFGNITSQSLEVQLVWENTAVGFTVNTDVDSRIMKQIETAMAPTDRKPYYEAASYYYESGKDLKQAFQWASKAVEQSPDKYWVEHLKAKIQLKMGDKKGAISSATSSMGNAKTQNNPDYVALNEKLIAEAKK
ncbi:DUF2911 domain-containing protein [Flavihumibacter sp. R14]|nr:DUF2911 domain-containing protein [Flavihumibacter soli]